MKISTSWLMMFVCLCLAPLLTGCAFTTDKIDLDYNMRGLRDKVPGASAAQVTVTITDDRKVKDKVSKKVNTGAIVSTTDVPELVRGAIQSELDARGFSRGDAVTVNTDLTQFWNHFKVGFVAGDSIADVDFTVTVKDKSGQVCYTKAIAEQGLEPNVQVAAGHNAKPALEQGLGKAMDDLFEDPDFIAALLKAGGTAPPPAAK